VEFQRFIGHIAHDKSKRENRKEADQKSPAGMEQVRVRALSQNGCLHPQKELTPTGGGAANPTQGASS